MFLTIALYCHELVLSAPASTGSNGMSYSQFSILTVLMLSTLVHLEVVCVHNSIVEC